MIRTYILLFIGFVFTSCLRLDDLLYSPQTITEYKLNNIDSKDISISKDLFLNESLIHPLILSSTNAEGGAESIYAYYLGDTSKISTDTVILYCHGNSENIDHYWQRATLLANIGDKSRYGVLIFDYQGYGKSTGKSSEEALYNDANTCMKWLKDQGLNDARLIIYGYSMGSAPAVRSCSKPKILTPHKLILESPFSSAEMMVSNATPLDLPKTYFTNLSIDNGNEIQYVSQDFLWFHGRDDSFLSLKAHGQVVFDSYQGAYKKGVIVDGAEHNNVPDILGEIAYLQFLNEFIKR
jgi:alpha/beta superfamily hydrolase